MEKNPLDRESVGSDKSICEKFEKGGKPIIGLRHEILLKFLHFRDLDSVIAISFFFIYFALLC